MIAYCGQTRASALVQVLKEHGIGECTVRGELLSRQRDPWFYDNGAFRDWQAGQPFNGVRFSRDMRRIRIDRERGIGAPPDFVIVPDLVARGDESLAFTRDNRDEIGVPGEEQPPAYLAVQDGMTTESVAAFLRASLDDLGHTYEGIFVGGSLPWKLDTGAAWVAFAHARDMRCHIGRVGTPTRIAWAHGAGADSIDSCLPLMHRSHLARFLTALQQCNAIA